MPGDTTVGKEYVALKDEIDRIATSTEFNGTRLLVGKTDMPEELQTSANKFPLEIQISKDYFKEADSIESRNQVDIIKIDMGHLNAYTDGEGSLALGRGEEGTRVDRKETAQTSIATLDTAITKVNEYRAYFVDSPLWQSRRPCVLHHDGSSGRSN